MYPYVNWKHKRLIVPDKGANGNIWTLRKELTGQWRKLHKVGLRNPYISTDIKPTTVLLMKHVE